MKTLRTYLKHLLPVASLLSVLPLSAAPMVSVGDNVDIFFNGSAGLRIDDNITLDSNNELDDFVFSLKPGVEVVLGRGQSNAEVTLIYQHEFLRYSEEDQFDTELDTFGLSGNYSGAKFEGSASFSYNESQSNTNSANIVGNLIESETMNFGAYGELETTAKISVGAGFNYVETDYVGAVDGILPDREYLSVPIDLYYGVSPKMDFTFGYRYRTTDVEGGNDPDDHNFTVGVRGELTPKVTGYAKIGYQARNFTVGNFEDTEALSADINLTLEASPKVTVNGSVYSDFNLGGAGGSIDEQGVRVDLNYAFNQLWSFRTGLGFAQLDFINENRNDDQITFGASVNYIPNDYLQVSAGYAYQDNDSNLTAASFAQNVLNLSASLRY